MGATVAIDRCEWCGHEHARDALCTSRPKWSRRGFLSLFGAGIAGLAVAPSLSSQAKAVSAVSALSDAAAFVAGRRGGKTLAGFDEILKAYYEPLIVEQLNARPLLWGDRETKGKTFCVHAR
jgi:hypothetical protein